ncbi:S8 family serine peptidase [Alteromonas sp. a30]|uniref:S8 family serine peptidase n=1 Tax=Alteromonas sp. a30 TaxID=2730917 RepID=UPI00228029B2|nr:S8 family serine peptidase [Alteromonas sp. a30]MCY7293892.1 S8 family serine peptidase [Alteromonas sp. a30]
MKITKNNVFVGLGVSALTLVATSVMAATPQKVVGGFDSKPTLVSSSVKDKEKTGRYIITFKEDAIFTNGQGRNATGVAMVKDGVLNAKAAEAAIAAVGGKYISSIEKQRMSVANLTKKQYNDLLNNRNVESVSDDPRRYLLAQSTPYGIPMVQANQLSQSNTTAREVCIIDTGYTLGHADLPSASGQANNSQVGSWSNDGNGHGTHVAGTVAALDNNTGVVGVFPGVDLHIVKIFNDQGNWTSASNIINAIQQCKDAGADVVSMSLGGSGSSSAEASSLQGFVNDGMMLIAAAGNSGNSSFSYPASYDAVMSVAAVDSSSNVASFSQYNSQVEIAGPGVAVNSTWNNGGYNSISGTSMATPHVSGVAALVWSYHQSCSNQQIRAALNATAQDRGASGRDNFYGHGIVKALDAVNYLNQYGCAGGGDGGNNGGGNGGGVEPVSGQLSGLSGSRSAWDRYTWDIPAGVATMSVSISGGSGDADLYLRYGAQPTTSTYDCRPYRSGNNETCTFNNPSSGTWHVGIRAYSTYSGVTMNYSYQ